MLTDRVNTARPAGLTATGLVETLEGDETYRMAGRAGLGPYVLQAAHQESLIHPQPDRIPYAIHHCAALIADAQILRRTRRHQIHQGDSLFTESIAHIYGALFREMLPNRVEHVVQMIAGTPTHTHTHGSRNRAWSVSRD